jgi:hypothetical protein
VLLNRCLARLLHLLPHTQQVAFAALLPICLSPSSLSVGLFGLSLPLFFSSPDGKLTLEHAQMLVFRAARLRMAMHAPLRDALLLRPHLLSLVRLSSICLLAVCLIGSPVPVRALLVATCASLCRVRRCVRRCVASIHGT